MILGCISVDGGLIRWMMVKNFWYVLRLLCISFSMWFMY